MRGEEKRCTQRIIVRVDRIGQEPCSGKATIILILRLSLGSVLNDAVSIYAGQTVFDTTVGLFTNH